MAPLDEPRWYSLVVRPKHEEWSAKFLSEKGFEPFAPVHLERRRYSDRIKKVPAPLFPGYIFARFPLAERGDVLRTPGVIAVVQFGSVTLPVEDEDILGIQRMIDSGKPLQTIESVVVGQKVRIEYGCFAGMEGIVQKMKDFTRLVIAIKGLGRSVAAEYDPDSVTPLAKAEAVSIS
jgi:transcription antitermination factor NusG